MGFLNELIRDLSLQPLHEALQKIVSCIIALVRCDSCLIYVVEGEELVLRASKNPHPEMVDRLKLKLGEGITGWVAERQEPVTIAVNASEDPRFKVFHDLPEDRFEAFLSVPVMSRGRVVGVINLQNRRPHRYNSREIRLISTVGALAGAEIEMARLEGQSAQDLTARRKAEEQLRQSQKMEAVGRLSAGIAHDFNNLLGVIIGYSEELEERLDPHSPLRHSAEQIKKAGDRAAALTRQLLAFSRQQVLKPEILDLNAVIADLDKMLIRLLGPDVELRVVLDPKLGNVKADRGQIEQVIINLAANARDAMPEGGKLMVHTSNADIDAAPGNPFQEMTPGCYASIVVSDTGMGMEPQVLSQIFEPFFTTKEQGKGTGLGLATAYGVVKQSGGYIWAESTVGSGTTFRIYLPHAGAAIQDRTADARIAAVARGSETILLVDDEEDLRGLVGNILENAGYTVLDANSGARALEVASAHRGPIHLLLTDILMPGMNGRSTAKALLEMRPAMQVLYTSGYAEFAKGAGPAHTESFLAKPFTRDTLLRKLEEVLLRRAPNKNP